MRLERIIYLVKGFREGNNVGRPVCPCGWWGAGGTERVHATEDLATFVAPSGRAFVGSNPRRERRPGADGNESGGETISIAFTCTPWGAVVSRFGNG